jgi:pimeloyl-ACP methyl ester carboxylesterase
MAAYERPLCANTGRLQGASLRIAGAVLINSVGIDAGKPELAIVDPTAVPPAERSALAFHDPQKFVFAASTPEAAAAMVDNQKALRAYAGEPLMHEPTLRSRLAKLPIPTLIIWGESDRIVRPDYGRLLASSIPQSRYAPVAAAGHFPQIEQSGEVERLISAFVDGLAANAIELRGIRLDRAASSRSCFPHLVVELAARLIDFLQIV